MKTPGIVAGIAAVALTMPALAGDEIRLTHNLSETLQYGTVAGLDSEAEPTTTRDNSWWRFFYRNQFDMGGDVRFNSVRFGVEQAVSGAGWQPVTVTLYAVEIDIFGESKMTQIDKVTQYVEDQTMSFVTVPVDAVLEEHEHLAVSIAPADFGALGMVGSMFFIGTNRLGQSGPSLISCPSAGDNAPTAYSSLGEDCSNLAIVMTVFGESMCATDCDGSGELDFFDFLCFVTAHAAGDPSADCDGNGTLDLFDVICFQDQFTGSCD